ncbi:hypothetical protein GBAR_LOCUS3108, partial [Geodia barretti]
MNFTSRGTTVVQPVLWTQAFIEDVVVTTYPVRYGMNSLAISSFMKKTRLWVKEMIHRSMVLAGEKSAVWTNDIPSSCVW